MEQKMANNQNNNLDSLQNNPYINTNANQNSRCVNCGADLSANQNSNQNTQNTSNQTSNTNAQNTTQSTGVTNAISSFFNSGNSQQDFLKGAFIGAVATFILTNKDAQKAIFKGFAKISSLFEMGVEELKERYEDAKAEVDAK